MTVVKTVTAMMSMLDNILLLTAILIVADTGVTVLKMKGRVAFVIMRIAPMMGDVMTGSLATEKHWGTTVIFL